jgi:hypothetical protein
MVASRAFALRYCILERTKLASKEESRVVYNMAHHAFKATTSGAIIVSRDQPILRHVRREVFSPGRGMFRWIAVHTHKAMVMTQV